MPNLASNALLDVEELRLFLGKDPDNPNVEESREIAFINGVSQWIEGFCGRKFRSGTDTWVTDGNGKSTMFVRYWPIDTVTSVSYWNSTQWTELVIATYPRSNNDQEIWFTGGAVFPRGRHNLRVVYVYGYARASVPADLKRAAADHIAWTIKALEKSGIASESYGEQTTTFNFDTPPRRIVDVYNLYRRITF